MPPRASAARPRPWPEHLAPGAPTSYRALGVATPPPSPPGAKRGDAEVLPPPMAAAAGAAGVEHLRRPSHAVFCALCVVVSLMVYSLLQERIMTRPYTHAGRAAYFRHSLLLVLLNRLLAVCTAALALAAGAGAAGTSERSLVALRGRAPLYAYAFPSLCNVVATSCQYEALKWLTFPTVTIGKCAKMLPVMLILNLRKRKRYARADFAVAAAVILGCAVMVRSGRVAAPRERGAAGTADADTAVGFALMLTYLLFDALTSTSQQHLFELYDTTVSNQMLFINANSAVLSFVALLMSGGAVDSVSFVARYPSSAKDIAALSAAAVAGQFAISHTIHAFGALLYAGIMTARQFASVLASDILFEHGLNAGQWAGASLVFGALFYKLYRKAVHSPSADDDK